MKDTLAVVLLVELEWESDKVGVIIPNFHLHSP